MILALARLHWVRRQGMLAASFFWLLGLRTVGNAWKARTIPAVPLALWTAGMASNGLVILANGGRMPTTAPWSRHPWCGQDCDHPKRLLWLGDVFRIGRAWASLGDALLVAGTAAFIGITARNAFKAKPATVIYPSGTVGWECQGGCGTKGSVLRGSFLERVHWCAACLDKRGIATTGDLATIEANVRKMEAA